MGGWMAGIGQGIESGVQGYRWMREQLLREKAQAEQARWREEDSRQRSEDRADAIAQRTQAQKDTDRARREAGFFKNTMPSLEPGDVLPAGSSSVSQFEEFAPEMIGPQTVNVEQPGFDPRTGQTFTPKPDGYPFLGTAAQRQQQRAREIIRQQHPELEPFMIADEAGLPAGAVAGLVRGETQLSPQQKADEAYLVEDARERARGGRQERDDARRGETTKRQAEVWKQNELAELEKAYRAPSKDEDNKPIPGSYGMKPEQLEAEKLRIENGYRAQLGLPPLLRLPGSWGAQAAPTQTQKPAPPVPVAVSHGPRGAARTNDPAGIR